MLLSVRQMELERIRFDRTFAPEKLDLGETEFRPKGEFRITGEAQLVADSDDIQVAGHICGLLEGQCDRCLETAPLVIDRDFDLVYCLATEALAGREKEIDASESEIGYYEGEGLQLQDVLREQVMLWIPMQWICGPECKGICPVCGCNRNQVSCECTVETADDRWAALRDLRLPEKPS